jgi:elongator complex protein 3
MPGLPGSNPKKDFLVYKKIFSSKNFKPDQVKIYPCQVIKNTSIEKWLYQRKYIPYDEKEVMSLLGKMLRITIDIVGYENFERYTSKVLLQD